MGLRHPRYSAGPCSRDECHHGRDALPAARTNRSNDAATTATRVTGTASPTTTAATAADTAADIDAAIAAVVAAAVTAGTCHDAAAGPTGSPSHGQDSLPRVHTTANGGVLTTPCVQPGAPTLGWSSALTHINDWLS